VKEEGAHDNGHELLEAADNERGGQKYCQAGPVNGTAKAGCRARPKLRKLIECDTDAVNQTKRCGNDANARKNKVMVGMEKSVRDALLER
jgi:hypothetical protein